MKYLSIRPCKHLTMPLYFCYHKSIQDALVGGHKFHSKCKILVPKMDTDLQRQCVVWSMKIKSQSNFTP